MPTITSLPVLSALTAALVMTGVDETRAAGDQNVQFPASAVKDFIGVPWVDPSRPPYNVNKDTPDCTTAFQQIITDYRDAGGCIILFTQKYKVQGGKLQFPDPIHGYGFIPDKCGFLRVPGTHGPLVECVPWNSAGTVAPTHLWHNITLDSDTDGVLVTSGRTQPNGATALDKATITHVPAADHALITLGAMFEGVGIPENMFVRSKGAVVSGFGTLVLEDINGVLMVPDGPNHLSNGAWFTRDKCVARYAIRVTGTTTTGTTQMTMSSTAGVFPGLRMLGVNLEIDGDDLSQWTRCIAVPNATTVRMDRNASASGAFLCVFYSSNDGMLWSEPSLITNYDPTKVYDPDKKYRRPVMEGVVITQSGGWNCIIRPGGNGYHIDDFCSFNNGYQGNISITACADGYWQRCALGPAWKECMRLASSSTPRGSGETYFTYLSDKYYEVNWLGLREGQMYTMEINGRLNIKIKPGDTAPLINFALINFKFAPNNRVPYGRTPAYMRVTGGCVNLMQVGFKAARDDITPSAADQSANGPWGPLKPDWLVETTDADSVVYLGGANWTDDVSKKECPYLLARTNAAGLMGNYFETDSKQILSCQRGPFLPVITCATPGDLTVAYTDQYGTWTAGNGTATFSMVIAFTPTYSSASGNLQITGLPFVTPVMAGGRQQRCSVVSSSLNLDWGTNLTQLDGLILSNGVVQVRATGDNKDEAIIVIGRMPSGVPQKLEIWATVPLVNG